MKRSRFSEEQIIAVLKEQEAGMATADVCRVERRCATSAVGRTMLRRGPASASWRGSAAGSAIADCTGCCAGKDGR